MEFVTSTQNMTVLAAIRTPLIWISLIFASRLLRNIQIPLSDEVVLEVNFSTVSSGSGVFGCCRNSKLIINQAIKMLEKSESLNKPLLVIGCGHKPIDCSKAHPPETAITLDRDPQIEPDYTIDFLSNSFPEGLQNELCDLIVQIKDDLPEYYSGEATKTFVAILEHLLKSEETLKAEIKANLEPYFIRL